MARSSYSGEVLHFLTQIKKKEEMETPPCHRT